MAETIESFVAKLQAEGIEAGQREAQKIRTEAEQQAEQIILQARQQAEKIIADANRQAENIISRGQAELRLAARDTVLRLKSALEQGLQAVLTRGAEQTLSDPQFLAKLLHDLCLEYGRADVERKGRIIINLRPDLRDQLLDWALQEISEKAQAFGMTIDLKGTLKEAGFEYRVSDAKVEITVTSVAETLGEMLSPKLREMVDQAIAGEGATTGPRD